MLSLQSEATKARLKLEKNFQRNMLRLNSSKLKADQRGRYAEEGLNELSVISLMAKIECASYYMLDEKEAGLYALEQYNTFIKQNRLNHRETLVKINEYTRKDASKVISEFLTITKNLETLQIKAKEQNQKLISMKEEKNDG